MGDQAKQLTNTGNRMAAEEYDRIAQLAGTHWWYRSLQQLVLTHIRKNFNTHDIRIIDAGCGTGHLMALLKAHGYKNITGFDLSEKAVQCCQKKGLDVFQGDLHKIASYFYPASADVIISNDSLYFLGEAEQKKTVCAAGDLLKKNGLLLINMPALRAFSGIHDLQVGIRKRACKKSALLLFEQNKTLHAITHLYWPFFISPVIWISRLRQRLSLRINAHALIRSDLKKENRFVNAGLLLLTRIENRMLSKKPFGSSLFLVLKKMTL